MMKPAAKSAKPDGPVDYELAFVGGFERVVEADGIIDADLTSPLLDPRLHPERSLRVQIGARPAGKKGGRGFAIDAFEIESIAGYLRGQAYVRQTLDADLSAERTLVDKKKSSPAATSGPTRRCCTCRSARVPSRVRKAWRP